MPAPESFCSAAEEVTCAACPLRLLDEVAWQQAVAPDITPFGLAQELRYVLEDTMLEVRAAQERSVIDTLEVANLSLDPELAGDDDLILDEALLKDVKSAAPYDASTMTTPSAIGRLRPTLDRSLEPLANPIAQALGACIQQMASNDCELSDEPDVSPSTSTFARLIDMELGAEVLNSIAQHGSDEEVLRMMQRLADAVADSGGQQAEINLSAVSTYRLLFSRFAAELDSPAE